MAFSLHSQHNVEARLRAMRAMELNIAKQPQQPARLKVHGKQSKLYQLIHSRVKFSDFLWLHQRLGPQRARELWNSRDNDKLSPDLSAALRIIHITEHKVKTFTALGTHAREFYESLYESLSHHTGTQ